MSDQAITGALLDDFISIFKGNEQNFGQHYYVESKKGEKEKGRSETKTDVLLTNEHYREHLLGNTGLGIIPITNDSHCFFGVLDVDVYTTDLSTYVNAIEANNLPLVPFRSKSGGLHIYCFVSTPIAAKEMITILNQFATLLALDILIKKQNNKAIEIFPKQARLQKGAVGSWINLPYYNAEKTKQYAIKKNKKLTLDEAIVYIRDKQTTGGELRRILNDMPFGDGPPCLQSMYILNPLERDTYRNEYLFGFGTYLKKKDENFYEQQLYELNLTMKEPLDEKELEHTIISSLRKKDYSYKCTQSPCADFCRKAICKTRTFGVGKIDGFFSELDYGKMYQIATEPPYYEWEIRLQGGIDYRRLRFRNEDEIISQDIFLRLCFRELHILPVKMKQDAWFKLVNQSLSTIEQINVEKDDDTSPIALFKSLFIEFIVNRAIAATKDQLMNKRVYFDKETSIYYFRVKDLTEYLFITKSFRFLSPAEVHGLLHDFKVTASRIRTETGKQIRVYGIHSANLGEDVMYSPKEKPFEPEFVKYDQEAF